MNPKEIREELNKAYAECDKYRKEVDALCEKESRQWTAEQNAKFKTLTDAFDVLATRLEREEELEKRNRIIAASTDNDGTGRANYDGSKNAAADAVTDNDRRLAIAGWMRARNFKEPFESQVVAAKKVGINLASPVLDLAMAPTHKIAELQRAYRAGGVQEAEKRAIGTITASAGGAWVQPETMMNQIEVAMLAYGGMLEVAETMTTPSGEPFTWPTFDDTSNTASRIGEAVAVTTTESLATAKKAWYAFKYTTNGLLVDQELLEDSVFNIEPIITDAFGTRIARKLNTDFTTGTGIDGPQGIVTGAALGKTTAIATAITFDEIVDLEHSVDPEYRRSPSCGFMFHDNILAVLRKLKDGLGQYYWAYPGSQVVGAPQTLHGYRYVINQAMASSVATTNKTMIFGDLSKYKVRRVRALRMYKLEERYREYDQTGFIAFIRCDGGLLNAGTNPVKYMQQA